MMAQILISVLLLLWLPAALISGLWEIGNPVKFFIGNIDKQNPGWRDNK